MPTHTIDSAGARWYDKDGKYHITGGPAYISTYTGTQFWYNDKRQLHRENGPAVIYADGNQSWWINNKVYFDNKSFQKAANLSDEDMLAIVLKYGNVE